MNKIDDSIYIPLKGRIYATENFPQILNDKKALELKESLPEDKVKLNPQNQYGYVASATRAANIDRYIQDFSERNNAGVIVQLGCGLETAFYRNNGDSGKLKWYAVDLENVISYRRELLEESENQKYIITDDLFGDDWIKQVRGENPNVPILVTAIGLFYNFDRKRIINLLTNLKNYGQVEIAFDTVNTAGMNQINAGSIKDSEISYFCVDNAQALAYEVENISVMDEEPYFAHIPRKGLKFMTKMSMKVSDSSMMVKMIHLNLDDSQNNLE